MLEIVRVHAHKVHRGAFIGQVLDSSRRGWPLWVEAESTPRSLTATA